MAEFTAEFKLVGWLTRSTVGMEPVDPRSQAIDDALHWIWSFRTTVERLCTSIHEEFSAFGSSEQLFQRKKSSRASLDEHCLAVVGGHLLEAITRVRRYVPFSDIDHDLREQITLFRNIYEHWNDLRPAFQQRGAKKTRAAMKLERKYPSGTPWSIAYSNDGSDILLGGLVSVTEVLRYCEEVEVELLAAG